MSIQSTKSFYGANINILSKIYSVNIKREDETFKEGKIIYNKRFDAYITVKDFSISTGEEIIGSERQVIKRGVSMSLINSLLPSTYGEVIDAEGIDNIEILGESEK